MKIYIYIYVFVYACILKTLFVLYVSCCLILILIPAKMNCLEVDRLKQAVQELVAHWFTGTDQTGLSLLNSQGRK